MSTPDQLVELSQADPLVRADVMCQLLYDSAAFIRLAKNYGIKPRPPVRNVDHMSITDLLDDMRAHGDQKLQQRSHKPGGVLVLV